MAILSCWLFLVVLPFFSESFQFPGPDDGPLIAALDFKNKMAIFDPALGPDAPLVDKIHLIGGSGGASVSADFNYKGNTIYWGDLFERRIYKMVIGNDGSINQSLISTDYKIGSPEGLAYDWIHDNLYVADWATGAIVVVNPTTSARKTLTNLTRVRDIEVDPKTGWLYYIAGWEETAMLYKSSLNGENQIVLSSDLERPKSLSLDYSEQRLYWAETYTINRIFSIGVNGEDKRMVYDAGRSYSDSPNYLTVSRDYMYWSQVLTSRVKSRNKHNGTTDTRYRNLEVYGRYNIPKYLYVGMLAIDPQKQQASVNLCGENNGGCSHFCLPSVIGLTTPYTCACPDDLVLMSDNQTCTVPSEDEE